MAEVSSVVLLVPLIIFGIGLVCLLSCVAFTCCVMQRRRYQRERELARLAANGITPHQGGSQRPDGELEVRPGTIIGTNHGGTQQVVVAQPPQPRFLGEIEEDIRRLSVSTNPARDFMRHGVPLSYCTPLHVTPQEMETLNTGATGETNTLSNRAVRHRRSSSAPQQIQGGDIEGADRSVTAEAAPLPPPSPTRGEENLNNAEQTHAQPAFAKHKSLLHSFASRLGSSFTSFLNLSADRPLYSLQTRGLVGYQQTNGMTTGGQDLMEQSAGGYNAKVRERMRQFHAEQHENQPLTIITETAPDGNQLHQRSTQQTRDHLASSMSGVLNRNNDGTPFSALAPRTTRGSIATAAWEQEANFMRTPLVPIVHGLQIPSSPAFLARRGSRRSMADSSAAPGVPATPTLHGNPDIAGSVIWNTNMALSLRETPTTNLVGSPMFNGSMRAGNYSISTQHSAVPPQAAATTTLLPSILPNSPYSATQIPTILGDDLSPLSPMPPTVRRLIQRESASSQPAHPLNAALPLGSSPNALAGNPMGMISSASQSTVVAKMTEN